MYIAFFLLIITSSTFEWKSVEKNGMSFSWEINGEYLECKVSSPGQGWLAIGFSEENKIMGSNLIMDAAEHGYFKMSDRYVVSFGQHVSMLSLGANEALMNRGVVEKTNGTTMSFEIKRKNTYKYHLILEEGKELYIWLAYSENDDFMHHSTMRTSLKIKL